MQQTDRASQPPPGSAAPLAAAAPHAPPASAPRAPTGQPPAAEPQPVDVPVDVPRPEHPRPDFRREAWINLNGRWRFAFDPQNVGEQMRWYRMNHPAIGAHPTTVHLDP